MLPPDNPWPVVLVLMCVVIGFGFQWISSRSRSSLSITLIAIGLAIACFAWSQFVETPTKAVVRQLRDMARAFQNHDVAKTKSYFSNQAKLPEDVDSVMALVHVHGDIRLTDISVTFQQANTVAVCHFRANALFSLGATGTPQHFPTRWELDWQREGNEWKIVEVRRLHLMNGKEVGFRSGI